MPDISFKVDLLSDATRDNIGFKNAAGVQQYVPKFVTDASGVAVGIADPVSGATLALSMAWSSGLPFVMPSSGNISNTAGAVAATTGFDYIIGPSYAFFPAAALYAASPAGWYYTVWSSATAGVVYANTYLNGNPQIPTNPTTLTTVVGAYTQTTGFDVVGPNAIIPANAMGNNGFIEWQRAVNNNNSGGNKIYNTYFGGTSFQGLIQTTNPREAGMGTIKNRGRKTAQLGVNAAHGDNNNASSLTKLSIDTAQAQVLSMTIQLAVATDYAIIESFAIRSTYGA